MAEPWSLFVLVVAVGTGLVTVTVLSVVAHSRQTAFFNYLQLQILLFNLLVLGGLVVQYFLLSSGTGGESSSAAPALVLLLALTPLKILWLYAFGAMMLLLPGQELPRWYQRRSAMTAVVLLSGAAVFIGVAAIGGAAARATVSVIGAIEALVVGGAIAVCLFLIERVRSVPQGPRRRAIVILGVSYLGAFVIMAGWLVRGWYRPANPGEDQVVNGALMVVCNLVPLVWTLRLQPRGPMPSLDALERFGITPREREIIALISSGCTNQEVADRLFISLATVKDHNYNIFRKMGVRNRVELVNLLSASATRSRVESEKPR